MLQTEYIVAYDQGTSGVKAAIVGMDGALIACASGTYPLYRPKASYAEQDPEEYWAAICDATAKVVLKAQVDPSKARGMVFGAIWKSVIPVDKDIRPLRRSIIWLDSRAVKEADEINKRIGEDWYLPMDYWPKLLWLYRNEPEIYDRAYKIIGVNSYLGWKATGNLATNISDSFVFAHSPAQQEIYDRALSGTGITKDKFVDWVSSSAEVGKLTAKAADELGLRAGIPVFAGSGDIQAIAIGSGGGIPGKVHAYFGSSGWMGVVSPFGEPWPKLSPLNEQYNVNIAGMKVGLALNWLVEQLYNQEKASMGDGVMAYIDQEAGKIPAGSEGLLSIPFLYGGPHGGDYRNERATFFNLKDVHTRAHMIRALMEGICMAMRMINIPKLEQTDPSQGICAVGGGACSDPWMQILANVVNMPVEVPYNTRHVGAVGAAYHALIGLGIFDDYAQAAANVRVEKTFYPKEAAVGLYKDRYEGMLALREALKAVYKNKG